MASRSDIRQLLSELYAARFQGDLDGVLGTFSPGAKFQILGSSNGKPISVIAVGTVEFRPWLSLMIKTFKLADAVVLSMLVDGTEASVHWRARIASKITGTAVLTEFVDLVRVDANRIDSYTEFFVPR